jgi:hypothetical protein
MPLAEVAASAIVCVSGAASSFKSFPAQTAAAKIAIAEP